MCQGVDGTLDRSTWRQRVERQNVMGVRKVPGAFCLEGRICLGRGPGDVSCTDVPSWFPMLTTVDLESLLVCWTGS